MGEKKPMVFVDKSVLGSGILRRKNWQELETGLDVCCADKEDRIKDHLQVSSSASEEVQKKDFEDGDKLI